MKNEKNITNRKIWIDNIKGFAIFLVILGHTPISESNRAIFTWIYSFHMPLFFIVSGVLFSNKEKNYLKFLKKNILALIVPYLIFQIINVIFYDSWNFLFGNFIPPRRIINQILGLFIQYRGTAYASGLWFLPCLFLMRNLLFLIEKISNKNKYIVIMILILTGIFYQLFINLPLPWYLDIVFINFIFLCIGYYFKEIIVNFDFKWYIIVLLMFLHLFSTYFNYRIHSFSTNLYWNQYGNILLFYMASITGSILWIVLFKKFISKSNLLTYIGKNSIVFYALHQGIIMPCCSRLLKIIFNNLVIPSYLYIIYYILESILVAIIIIPICFVINKYFPFMLGKNLLNKDSNEERKA